MTTFTKSGGCQLIFTCISLLLFAFTASAQQPESLLGGGDKDFPLEKIYIHTDKPNYTSGDTIWFKAFLMADEKPSMLSSTIAVMLVNDSGRSISKLLLPVTNGGAEGSVTVPGFLPAGHYSLQAYTQYMRTYGSDVYYVKGFDIYNLADASTPATTIAIPRMEFFPESGNLIAGIENTVAYKSTDQFGFPMPATGHIKDIAGNTIMTFATEHDGMGKIILNPEAGKTYTAEMLYEKGSTEKFFLPTALASGLGLQVTDNEEEIYYSLNTTTLNNDIQKPAFLLVRHANEIIYRTTLSVKTKLIGIIPRKELPSGVSQITFYNKEGKPLCERLVFINKGEWQLIADLKTITQSLVAKGKNVLQLQLQDTTKGSFVASVIDADYELGAPAMDNIAAAFLLSQEMKGYVHQPAQYLLSNSDSTRYQADLLMMTNGWRRYNWTNVEGSRPPSPELEARKYITIEGDVYDKYSAKPITNTAITAIITNGKEVSDITVIPVDDKGKFRLKNVIAYDSIRIEVIKLGNNIINASMRILSPNISSAYTLLPKKISYTQALAVLPQQQRQILADGIRVNEITLQGILLQSKRPRSPQEITEDKYTKGTLFRGDGIRKVDFMNEAIVVPPGNSVLQYLSNGQLMGVSEVSPGTYVLRGSRNFTGYIPMQFYLNNFPTDVSQLSSVLLSDVAMMKLYSSNLLVSSANGGMLAIFTKDHEDYQKKGGSRLYPSLTVEGYTPIKEFYNPDYEQATADQSKPDTRSTLYWNPSIITDAQNRKFDISFFKNDNAKKLKLVITGFNENGKMLYMEKVIE